MKTTMTYNYRPEFIILENCTIMLQANRFGSFRYQGSIKNNRGQWLFGTMGQNKKDIIDEIMLFFAQNNDIFC